MSTSDLTGSPITNSGNHSEQSFKGADASLDVDSQQTSSKTADIDFLSSKMENILLLTRKDLENGESQLNNTLDSNDNHGNASSSGAAAAAATFLSSSTSSAQFAEHQSGDNLTKLLRNHEKHVFILSDAGKPIFSRHLDEHLLVTEMGLISAMVSKLHCDPAVDMQTRTRTHAQQAHTYTPSNRVLHFVAGRHRFVFLHRPHLILVCVSASQESVTQLSLNLLYLYNVLLSSLTTVNIDKFFRQRSNFDLRSQLRGEERRMRGIIDLMDSSFGPLLGAVRCLPTPASLRDSVANCMLSNIKAKIKQIGSDLVFALMLSRTHLISCIRHRGYLPEPMDLHLLFNLISNSDSLNRFDNFFPICLPQFDSGACLFAHLSFMTDSICLILLTVDEKTIASLSDCHKNILERMTQLNLLDPINIAIEDAKKLNGIRLAQIPEVSPHLRHFLYKRHTESQYVCSALSPPFQNNASCHTSSLSPLVFPPVQSPSSLLSPSPTPTVSYASPSINMQHSLQSNPLPSLSWMQILNRYRRLHAIIHNKQRPIRLLYHRENGLLMFGWLTKNFEMFTILDPTLSKQMTVNILNKLLKWLDKERDNLFITSFPEFSNQS